MQDLAFTLFAAFDRKYYWRGGGSVRHIVVRLKAERTAKVEKAEQTPLNIALVIDASDSMGENKLEFAKAAAISLVDRLKPKDRLTVVSFASEVMVHINAVTVTPENLDRINAEITALRPQGRTFLSGGLLAGVECVERVAKKFPQMTPRVILLSDGMANVGSTDHSELFKLAGELRTRGVMTSILGLGDDYDKRLLRGMAEHGGGRLHDADFDDEFHSVLRAELGAILHTVVEDARVILSTPANVTVELLGSEIARSEAGRTVVSVGSVQDCLVRILVFKVTCPETDVLSHELDFKVMADGRAAENPGASIVSEPVMLSLMATEREANVIQTDEDAQAESFARIWVFHHINRAAALKRMHQNRQYRPAPPQETLS